MNYDKKHKQVYFSMADLSTLSNICQAAATRFAQDAEMFRPLENYKPAEGEITMVPHGMAATRLVEQFERQAKEAHAYRDIFQMACDTGSDFAIPMEPEDYAEASEG